MADLSMSEWIFGRNPVYEVLRAGRRQCFRLHLAEGLQEKGRLAEILHLCQQKKLPVDRVSRGMIQAKNENTQGVALLVGEYPYSSLQEMLALADNHQEPAFLVILDALQDPQNLGTLLRSAEAVGVHGVLLPLRQTVTVTSAVVHASSGASEHLLIGQANLAQAIREIKQAGVWVIGLDAGEEAETVESVRLDGPIALVAGSEGQGMRALVRDSCDILMRLPMRGLVGSLNVAVAGSIALYLVWQKRDYLGNPLLSGSSL
jgi:23S rRNA (guanosine2251-2'-O)-methyltransferase